MALIYAKEAYDIMSSAFHVYNVLKEGFLEPVYQEALEIEFKKNNIPFKREVELPIYYDGHKLSKTYRADFICYDSIILELKAVKEIDDTHRSQLFNYLKATNMKLGILINFGHYNSLEWERIVK